MGRRLIAPNRILESLSQFEIRLLRFGRTRKLKIFAYELDIAQRMSQFIEGIAAPTFGDFGDGVRSGPRSLGDESGPEFYITLISAQMNSC
jgi:hypothetical protein